MVPVVKAPDVSRARVAPVIVPELSIVTPGLADPPVHVIAVPAERVAPLWTVPVSLLVTVFAAVSVVPVVTVKLAARAGAGAISAVTLAARAMRLTLFNKRDMFF
jgi:hypothetical protein